MVIVVPPGEIEDHTRHPTYYDPVFSYLREIGLTVLS